MWRQSIKLSFRSIARHRINPQQFTRFFSEVSASYSEDEDISTREEIFACLKTEGCSNGGRLFQIQESFGHKRNTFSKPLAFLRKDYFCFEVLFC